MRYRKIHIIGAPGSGKTFSADKLQQLTNINTCDLDRIFWDQSKTTYIRANEKCRTKELNKILSQDHWIIEGVYYKWLADSFHDADIIVFLNPSVFIRQWRIFKRFLKRKFILGHFRKETLSSFIEMFWWNQKFDKDNRLRILSFTKAHQDKLIFCKNFEEISLKLKLNENLK